MKSGDNDKLVQTRVSPLVFDAVAKLAADAGLSVASWLRRELLAKLGEMPARRPHAAARWVPRVYEVDQLVAPVGKVFVDFGVEMEIPRTGIPGVRGSARVCRSVEWRFQPSRLVVSDESAPHFDVHAFFFGQQNQLPELRGERVGAEVFVERVVPPDICFERIERYWNVRLQVTNTSGVVQVFRAKLVGEEEIEA